MWCNIQSCGTRIILSAVVCVSGMGVSAARGGVMQASGPLHFIGEYPPGPVVPSFFNVFVNIYPPTPVFPPDPVFPPSPVLVDLSDPTLPGVTADVDNHALFDFGMIGPGGEPVTFDSPAVILNSDGQSPTPGHLLLHTQAHFGANSWFDVFFDTFYTYPPNPVYPPGVTAPVSFSLADPILFPPEPVFPQRSLIVDFAATANIVVTDDPSFTVDFYVIDPITGDRAVFSNSSVPEPGTFTLWGAGVTILAGWRWRAKKRSRVILRAEGGALPHSWQQGIR